MILSAPKTGTFGVAERREAPRAKNADGTGARRDDLIYYHRTLFMFILYVYVYMHISIYTYTIL